MAQAANYLRTTDEVFGVPTVNIKKKSKKTGNDYSVDAISSLEVVCTGDPEKIERNGEVSYKYSVFYMKKNLTFEVNCPNAIKIGGVKQVILTNLFGGPVPNSSKAWFKADRISFPASRSR